MDVIHSAFRVSDLETSLAFYTGALDLERQLTFTVGGVENVYVGGEHGAIQLQYDPDGGPVDPDRETFDHVALGVDDVDATLEHLQRETDTEVVTGPLEVPAADAYVVFLTDPDGYVVELVEPLGE